MFINKEINLGSVKNISLLICRFAWIEMKRFKISGKKEQDKPHTHTKESRQKIVYKNTAFIQKQNAYFMTWSRKHSRIKNQFIMRQNNLHVNY